MPRRETKDALPGFWHEDRHLSFFLALLVIITIFVPMFGLSRAGRIAIDLIFALMLFSGAMATLRKPLLLYMIIALTILGIRRGLDGPNSILNFSFRGSGYPDLKSPAWRSLGSDDAQANILSGSGERAPRDGRRRRLLAHRRHLGLRLQAAAPGISRLDPLPIVLRRPFDGREPSRLLYFSFATLTTVSFGDVYHTVHRIARAMAIGEALIGQLYPAILIASLVSMALQSRFSETLKENGPKNPD